MRLTYDTETRSKIAQLGRGTIFDRLLNRDQDAVEVLHIHLFYNFQYTENISSL